MQISESKENYLETIYILLKQNNTVLAIDIANYLGYSRASVSAALKELGSMNLIKVGLHKAISLTPAGLELASQIHDRHCFFSDLLENAGIEQNAAENDACKLMHAISTESFLKLKRSIRAVR